MAVRVGCSLAPWADAPPEQALEDAERSGYDGVVIDSLLDAHRGTPGALRNLLDEFGLVPASSEFSAWFFDRARLRDELEELRRMLDILSTLGCEVLVLAASTIQERLRVAGLPASTSEAWVTRDQLRYLADGLSRAGDISREFGLTAVFRNRAGSFVETRAEVDLIAEHTESEVIGLALDAAHLVYGGVGVEKLPEIFGGYAQRMRYWPVQNIKASVLERVRAERLPFAAATEAGVFVEPGQGDIDLVPLAESLHRTGFDGWVVSVLEHPTRTAADAATAARDYIGEKLGY